LTSLAAGARELAILIFLLSFAWPYTKQLLTFGLWFAPPKMVSVKRRGSILLWLDAQAKWSMADIFILIITIVSFRVSVKRYVSFRSKDRKTRLHSRFNSPFLHIYPARISIFYLRTSTPLIFWSSPNGVYTQNDCPADKSDKFTLHHSLPSSHDA